MNIQQDLKYTSTHEWVKILDEDYILVGITDFAQRELGDIVYVDITHSDVDLKVDDAFGTIEAIKTVSDLLMPLSGKIMELNTTLEDAPETINQDAYEQGWIVKIKIADKAEIANLLAPSDYEDLIKTD